jgi:hypothetical protein
MRDLIPDMAGASLGALLGILSRQVRALRSPAHNE